MWVLGIQLCSFTAKQSLPPQGLSYDVQRQLVRALLLILQVLLSGPSTMMSLSLGGDRVGINVPFKAELSLYQSDQSQVCINCCSLQTKTL